jgi:hypothetical protein
MHFIFALSLKPQKHKKGHDIECIFTKVFANVVCRLLNAAKVEMNTSLIRVY